MSERKRKLLFYEIGKGEVALEAQLEFERLQNMVAALGKKATMTIKITVHPSGFEDVELDKRFGKVSAEVIPAKISHTTEVFTTEKGEDGVACCDGKSIDDVLQEVLFPEESVKDKMLKMGNRKAVSDE